MGQNWELDENNLKQGFSVMYAGMQIQRTGYSADKKDMAFVLDKTHMEASGFPKDAMAKLFNEKIALYEELVGCLDQERQVLIKSDMDELWEVASRKTSLISKINDVRVKILEVLTQARIPQVMDGVNFDLASVYRSLPFTCQDQLRRHYQSLVRLKSETRSRSEENKQFIQECLEFMDDLVQILAAVGKDKVYGKGRAPSAKNSANLLFHKEIR